MTTDDDFTAAAYDQALSECGSGKADYLDRLTVWLMGAHWARNYATQQEPTDAEVRAAAIAIGELDGERRGLDGFTYSHIARAALRAARDGRSQG